jgi:fosfomycin resistance protein FosX
MESYRDKLASLGGVEFLNERSRVPGEGQSLYFYDFDNNLFELHSGSLESHVAAYDARSAHLADGL